jgi:hypothetical protein
MHVLNSSHLAHGDDELRRPEEAEEEVPEPPLQVVRVVRRLHLEPRHGGLLKVPHGGNVHGCTRVRVFHDKRVVALASAKKVARRRGECMHEARMTWAQCARLSADP